MKLKLNIRASAHVKAKCKYVDEIDPREREERRESKKNKSKRDIVNKKMNVREKDKGALR